MNSTHEVSAGALLSRDDRGKRELLLIRIRKHGFEIPKGHIESGESPEEAALRELREETGITSALRIGPSLGEIEYSFKKPTGRVHKKVYYFTATTEGEATFEFGPRPAGTRELRWISAEDLDELHLVSEDLLPPIRDALGLDD